MSDYRKLYAVRVKYGSSMAWLCSCEILNEVSFGYVPMNVFDSRYAATVFYNNAVKNGVITKHPEDHVVKIKYKKNEFERM